MPLVHGKYSPINPDFLLAGSLVDRRNMPRIAAVSDTASLATGVAISVAIALQAGDVVSKIAFKSGATAMVTPTNWAFGLYDTAGNLLGQTATQGSAAWGANTVMDLSLTTAVAAPVEGVYFASVFVAAATPPTLVGATLALAGASAGILATDKILARTHGSALTTTFPATIATPTTVATVPLVIVH